MLLSALLAAADPPQLLPAREQMAFTLGFTSTGAVRRRVSPHDAGLFTTGAAAGTIIEALLLGATLSKVAAVLFAVGAVSGTVLSFELGLLWPGSWQVRGGVRFPFALRGAFFFRKPCSWPS